jgi:hypothetical protein
MSDHGRRVASSTSVFVTTPTAMPRRRRGSDRPPRVIEAVGRRQQTPSAFTLDVLMCLAEFAESVMTESTPAVRRAILGIESIASFPVFPQ